MYELTAFTGALFLMVITPGPGVLACVSRALASGIRMAVFVVLGIILGDLFFLLMAIYGLAAVAELLGNFFVIVRYCGAVYLIWLGYRTWTAKVDTRGPAFTEAGSRISSFLSGLSITFGNPKAIVFYLSFLPAFIDLENLDNYDVLLTAAIIIITLATVLFGYSFAANKARALFARKSALKGVNRCSGTAMVAAGVVIAIKD